MKILISLVIAFTLVGCSNELNRLQFERGEIECKRTNETVSIVGEILGAEYVKCHPTNRFKWLSKN